MTNLQRIDKEIKDLQRIRRMIVKGEKKFNKEDHLEILNFETDLENHNIPYSVFTYGNSVFYKIEEPSNKFDETEDLQNAHGQVFDPNC